MADPAHHHWENHAPQSEGQASWNTKCILAPMFLNFESHAQSSRRTRITLSGTHLWGNTKSVRFAYTNTHPYAKSAKVLNCNPSLRIVYALTFNEKIFMQIIFKGSCTSSSDYPLHKGFTIWPPIPATNLCRIVSDKTHAVPTKPNTLQNFKHILRSVKQCWSFIPDVLQLVKQARVEGPDKAIKIYIIRKRYSRPERQTDRQTDTQTDRQTDKHTDR